MIPFTFGVLIGTVVATAYANYPKYPAMDSPEAPARASMMPFEMMWSARGLPVERHDAF
jgi:cytochrome c-type biogenesis protein CcmH/NrfG